MDCDERLRSVCDEVLKALEEALAWLERPPAEGLDMHDGQRSGMFQLGAAGGLAFSARLPGIKSEALFDDISAGAEKQDVGQVGRVRRKAAARLRTDHPPHEFSPGKCGLDWAAGVLQMLAVLNEARTAREEGDAVSYSLMAGFLVGLMSEGASGIRYRHGSLKDAVLAAHDRNPERARTWVKAESIMAGRGRWSRRERTRVPFSWNGWDYTWLRRIDCPAQCSRASRVRRRMNAVTERPWKGNIATGRKPPFSACGTLGRRSQPGWRQHVGSRNLFAEPCPRARISRGRPPGRQRPRDVMAEPAVV